MPELESEKGGGVMSYIVKRNRNATLVNLGEGGYWVIAVINGRRTRLFAGGTPDKAERVYNWYETKGE